MDDREIALMLFGSVEELYVRVMAQEATLDVLVGQEDEDWQSHVQHAVILQAPQIHALFDRLRSELFAIPQTKSLPKDWEQMVRRIVEGKMS
jgi:hypothetical protein